MPLKKNLYIFFFVPFFSSLPLVFHLNLYELRQGCFGLFGEFGGFGEFGEYGEYGEFGEFGANLDILIWHVLWSTSLCRA